MDLTNQEEEQNIKSIVKNKYQSNDPNAILKSLSS